MKQENNSLNNHKYSLFFNNLVANEVKENGRKRSDTSSSISSNIFKNQRSGKKSTIISNHQTIISMRNDSQLISEVFEEESDDELPIKANKLTLHQKY